MDQRYSLIVVSDETSPIRRFDVMKKMLHRAAVGAGLALLLLMLGLVDYVTLRVERPEFLALRAEAEEQRTRIAAFEAEMSQVTEQLERVRELERKVRIIANLPGAAGSGGGEIADASAAGGRESGAEKLGEEEVGVGGEGEPDAGAPGVSTAPPAEETGPDRGQRVSVLREEAERLGLVADAQSLSLKDLLDRLHEKQNQLASSPAIWPTKGWLTSRFGYRISPFTGRRQFHSGIDIAGRRGTDVIAPARGKVTRMSARGPLGKSITIDHGYGVRTFYGHLEEYHVKKGQVVDRGQVIATLGNSGRSTGPHLHYSVEVQGKAVNPLDYIFD